MTWDRSIVLAAMLGMLIYILALFIWPSLAPAQIRCGPHQKAVDAITGSQFREQPAARGLSSNGRVMLLFANPDTGTWTLLTLGADGTSCLMDAGEDFERMVLGRPL